MYHTTNTELLTKYIDSRANELNIAVCNDYSSSIVACFAMDGDIVFPVNDKQFNRLLSTTSDIYISNELTEQICE
jgi:hypothetical protein